MPKLPTFTAEVGGLPIAGGRRATAEDFGGGEGLIAAGRAVGRAAETFLSDMEEREQREVMIKNAELRAKYVKRLDEAATTGEDVEKIQQEFENDASAIGENLQTRRGREAAQLHTTNSGAVFQQAASVLQVQRASIEARMAGQKFLSSTSALVASQPTYLSQAEQDVDAFVSTLQRVPPEKRAAMAQALKQDLNMAAAMSLARIDPQQTKNALEGGQFDLSPEQRRTALNQAETAIRAQRAEEAHFRALREYEEREANDKARDVHFKAIMQGSASARQILDDPNLQPSTREHLIVFMEHRAKALAAGEKKSDPVAVRDLWLRIHAPEGDPRRIFTGDPIFQAVEAGRVSTTDANQLNTLVMNQKDENNRTIGSKLGSMMGAVGRALSQDPRYIGQPALVAEIQMDYQARVFDQVKRLRDAGQDPSQVFNPASKDYVGSREFIQGSVDTVTNRARQEATLSLPRPQTQEEYDAIPAGATYVSSTGAILVKKAGKAAVPAADERAEWMAETGGRLEPGQTTEQAFQAWRERRAEQQRESRRAQ